MGVSHIVVVGGVAGGMSAATRARRMNEHTRITVIERGGYISFANCGLPYHIAGRIVREDKLLVTTVEQVRARFAIDVRVQTEVMRIDRAGKTVEVRDLKSGQVEMMGYDKLILATGASAIVPGMEHVRAENVFTLRSMEDTRAIQKYLGEKKPKSAVIVGAGFIGLEMAEALHDRGLAVTVVEKVDHVLPPLDREVAVDVEHELRLHHVEVITGTGLAGLVADEAGRVTHVVLEDQRKLAAELVLLSIGVRANVGLAKEAGLTIGASGAIAVDGYQRTSDADIYAVGDVAEVTHGVTGRNARVPLAGPANKQGRLAGEHAASGEARGADKPVGTAVVQVFSETAGLTGLGEDAARKAGFDVDTAYVSGGHHAGYYPGAERLRIKIIYDRATGKLVGGQIVGKQGVDKRIDVLATVLHFGGTIDDLAALDLAYAPQFGSAKDLLHMAGFVAQNQRSGVTAAVRYRDVNGASVIDVRTTEEFARGSVPGARNIPLDDLRGRLGELERTREYAVMCQVGLRGHVAARILSQNGIMVKNIKGGYALAKEEMDVPMEKA